MGLDLKSFLKWVFDASGRSSASLLLESNAARVASMCGVSTSTLLVKNTIFPYATAFQKEGQVARLRSLLLSPSPAKVGAVAPLVANSVHRGFRRFCPECVIEDLDAFGESYWRRSHQLATVFVCTKHDALLLERLGCAAATLNTRGLDLPHHSGRTRRLQLLTSLEIARGLSCMSESLLGGTNPLSDWRSDSIHEHYRRNALELGFTYPAGGVATGVIADCLARFYGSRFLDELGCRVNTEYDNSWPSLLFRRSSYQATAVRQVLLQYFLAKGSLDEEALAALKERRYQQRNYLRLDADLAKSLRAEIKRLQREKTTGTATQILKSTSSYGTFKHNRHRLPVSREVLEAFKRSVFSARRVRKDAALGPTNPIFPYLPNREATAKAKR